MHTGALTHTDESHTHAHKELYSIMASVDYTCTGTNCGPHVIVSKLLLCLPIEIRVF